MCLSACVSEAASCTFALVRCYPCREPVPCTAGFFSDCLSLLTGCLTWCQCSSLSLSFSVLFSLLFLFIMCNFTYLPKSGLSALFLLESVESVLSVIDYVNSHTPVGQLTCKDLFWPSVTLPVCLPHSYHHLHTSFLSLLPTSKRIPFGAFFFTLIPWIIFNHLICLRYLVLKAGLSVFLQWLFLRYFYFCFFFCFVNLLSTYYCGEGLLPFIWKWNVFLALYFVSQFVCKLLKDGYIVLLLCIPVVFISSLLVELDLGYVNCCMFC